MSSASRSGRLVYEKHKHPPHVRLEENANRPATQNDVDYLADGHDLRFSDITTHVFCETAFWRAPAPAPRASRRASITNS